ncbi:hypothetical protein LGN12_30480 [Burkholderia multivorans]|nr:hypothetical protein [Burkholderia multivorans]
MLLPLPLSTVRERSLVAHVALAAFQSGDGSSHLLYQLVRVVYLSYLMSEAGTRCRDIALFRDAERALEHAARKASETSLWTLAESDAELMEEVIRAYDSQLEAIQKYRFLECLGRLETLVTKTIPQRSRALFESEIPDMHEVGGE